MHFTDADYPCDPYPGRRPDTSFVHEDGVGHKLAPVPPPRAGCVTVHAPSGYVVAREVCDVDSWLSARAAPPLAERTPLLAYGSNACPSKLTWLREHLGLTGPVVVLRAQCTGLAAVWAAGLRARDGRRPVTLTAIDGVVEEHAVLMVTREQLRVFDDCEGHGVRYRRSVLADGAVRVRDGGTPPRVQAYLGVRADRMPLLVDGRPARAALLAHADAQALLGTPAREHGVIATPAELEV